jgi:acyl carrier protein
MKRIRSAEYTELLGSICDVFAEVLGKERNEITETSNFITLGGDSMQYVELLSKVGEKTGKQIIMNETPLITPMAIADYIMDSNEKKDEDNN